MTSELLMRSSSRGSLNNLNMTESQKRGSRPSNQFADEFDEFQARATGGGSLFGSIRRQAFAASRPGSNNSSTCSNPPVPMDRRRPRSKSLAPTHILRTLLPKLSKGQCKSSEDLNEDDLPAYPPPNFRHPRRFSAACVDARDVTCKHNIRVSISPPTVATRGGTDSPWGRTEVVSDSEDNNGTPTEPTPPTLLEVDKLMPPDLSALIANMPEEPIPGIAYRRRSFSITPKGIVNEGDWLISRFGASPIGAGSVGSDIDTLKEWCSRSRTSSLNSAGGSPGWSGASSSGEAKIHKVLMLGALGVGKTALTQQFMTSEYMGAQNTSFDDDLELSINVLLDGEESILEFTDIPDSEGFEQWKKRNADAYVVVYSVADRSSFERAIDLIEEIRHREECKTAVILVANKTDLQRARVINEAEGKARAEKRDCKYIEVSAVLNHKVDDLLVGVLKQIRLTPERQKQSERRKAKAKVKVNETDIGCLERARRNVIDKLLRGNKRMSKSCENLLTL